MIQLLTLTAPESVLKVVKFLTKGSPGGHSYILFILSRKGSGAREDGTLMSDSCSKHAPTTMKIPNFMSVDTFCL